MFSRTPFLLVSIDGNEDQGVEVLGDSGWNGVALTLVYHGENAVEGIVTLRLASALNMTGWAGSSALRSKPVNQARPTADMTAVETNNRQVNVGKGTLNMNTDLYGMVNIPRQIMHLSLSLISSKI